MRMEMSFLVQIGVVFHLENVKIKVKRGASKKRDFSADGDVIFGSNWCCFSTFFFLNLIFRQIRSEK